MGGSCHPTGFHGEHIIQTVFQSPVTHLIQLIFQIASFINVVAVRPISSLKRTQRKRPILDIWLETQSASCWVGVIAIMILDGVHQYGHNGWDGRLIALLACAGVML